MLKVIIADDDIEMLHGLKQIIPWEDFGYSVAGTAENGFAALSLIGEIKPDLLIADITMPGIDGLELIRGAKKLKNDMRSIVLTCHEDFIYAKEAIKLDVSDYLVKYTLTAEELVEAILKVRKEIESGNNGEANGKLGCNNRIQAHRKEIAKVLEFIDCHMDEMISCEAMAKYVNLNCSYFSRLFKDQTGVSFSDCLKQKRLERATDLLINTELCIEDIAKAIGIENSSYFYRFYKRETGHTPGDIRRDGYK